jgi:trigger factor
VEIQFEKKEKASALLTISLEEQDYQSDYQAKIKDYSKRVQMKGFRPGKVPPTLVERMYGPALKSEAINNLLNKSIDGYLKENNIQVLGDMISDETKPLTEGDNTTGPLTFSFAMALRPEVKYPAMEKMTIEFPEISITEDRVTSFIAEMQKRYGPMEDAEKISEGDLIKGNLKAVDGNFETESSFPFSRIKEGYRDQFIGKKLGEVFEFPIEEAFDSEEIRFVTNTYRDKGSKKEFSGMYSLEITSISTSKPAELNVEFFDKVVGKGAAITEEEFKEKVRELFSNTYEEESKAFFQMALDKYLYQNSEIEISEEIVSKVIKGRADGKMTEAELGDFLPKYLVSLKKSLIKSAISTDFKISLTREDILEQAREKVRAELKQMGLGQMDDEFLDKFAENFLKDKEQRNEELMAEKALAAKIANLISEKGNIVRKSVSIEEFNKLVEELN